MQCMRNKQTDLESIKPIWYLWLDSWGPCVSCTFKIWVVKWVSEWVIDCHLFWTRSHSCQVPKGVPTGSYSMLAMVCWHCKEIRNVRVHCSGGFLKGLCLTCSLLDGLTRWLEWDDQGLENGKRGLEVVPWCLNTIRSTSLPTSSLIILYSGLSSTPPYCLNLILCAPHFTFDFSPSIWTLTIFI